MAIDLQTETILALRDVASKTCFKVHISSLHRWRLRGIRGIRLETALVGGARVTSVEALQRFSEALSRQNQACTSRADQNRSVNRRVRSSEAVLDRAGIKS